MEPIEIMLDDLGRQIAQKSLALAEWKARALTAENTLAEIQKAAQEEDQDEEPGLSVVKEDEDSE